MKVLILHQHFKSPYHGGAIRSYYLAKALVDKGHSVKVITGANINKYQSEHIDGIEVHFLPVLYENRFKFIRRTYSFLTFVAGIIRRPLLYKDVDMVYTISVPLTIGIASMWIKKIYKIPYVFEVGDLWPEAPIELGFVRNYILKKILFALEKTIYTKSACIVALSPAIKDGIEKRIRSKKIHLIPNMSDTCFYKPSNKLAELEKKYDVKNKFVVSYIGAIGLANGLDYFLQCAKVSQPLPLKFLLCGDGAMLEELRASAKRMKLENLAFIPFQNRDGVNEIMNVSDAVFICYKPVPILETGSPNKYFDGLSAGKLIVLNFGGWIKEEVEKNKCGIYVDPHQPLTFLKEIEPFVANQDRLKAYQLSSRSLAERFYSRKALSEKFVSLIEREVICSQA
ncbi:MAG TPA: glycosyltransferase family 4 protein [Cyclobacteriaceae bacterium]|nr:glycosyltransferase family 4 protein [Cyclobacteriaceae bacterium]